jgi:dipeptidyl aminopeptidase/acylaminoacyl peptidase
MTTSELIPRSVLFGNPERVSPRVSPDGKRLAYIAPHHGVLNVFVGPLDGEAEVVTDDRDRGIRFFDWAHDNRHLVYVQDKGGDENWRLYSVDLSGDGGVQDLTPFDGVQAQPLGESKRRPHELLVGLNKDNEQLHDVYLLDFRTGSLEKIEENPGFIGWVADEELDIRLGVAPTADGGFVFMLRGGGGGWEPLLTVGQEDALSSQPMGFSADGASLFAVTSVGANAGRLVRIDVTTGEQSVLFEDSQYDVTQVVQHPDTREPQVVGVLGERLQWHVLDASVAADMEGLAKLHPGDMSILSRDHADAVWVVAFTADDGPVQYYVWDRASQSGTYLFSQRPDLERYELAPMEPFSFVARDGLEVHGYASFPPGVNRAGLPAVVNVHGGPWTRDVWGLNPEAQWFASRGYVCVQVNYRGSTGYGKEFVNAGDREWGGKMHDDLLDAVEYVVGQGWVDRERVAIYGGSYGGYAALVGATFTPDVFACAVDIVGPSSIKTLIESIPPYWAPQVALFHTRVGNPETEEEFLWSRSPLSKVDQIKIPMLIAQGANDPRVKQAESEQIVEAMRENGVPHEYLLYEDEGHGFAKPDNRLSFYAAAERFLARHLGGRAEEDPGSPALS